MVFFVLAIITIIGIIICRISIENQIKKVKDTVNAYDGKKDVYPYRNYTEVVEECKSKEKTYKMIEKIVSAICLVFVLLFIFLSVATVVPTGHTGIKTTFGKVENDVLPSGISFKLPWQNVICMDNREQRSSFVLEAFSKDIQQVDIQGSINININKTTAMNLYKDVGTEYKEILVAPRIYEDVKIVIAQYTAENLIENRQKASDSIYDLLKSELSEKGINVISFAIENIDFTDAFESAVEAKQVATQEKQKAQTEQERQTMEMKQKAERDRIQAQAAADVQKIDADAKAYAVKVEADAQAEANKKIAETLSDSLVRYNTVNKWNGKLPTVTSGDSANNIIDLRSLVGDDEE